MYKRAFTLVELIVTITILSILWVIVFISFQWYGSYSRDSSRITDISQIKTSLWLYIVQKWDYPKPTNWVNIFFSWSILVWTQWNFWNTIFNNLSNLSKLPIDPLTKSEYTYSINQNNNEYEISSITEWSLLWNNNINLLNKTYADSKINALAFVTWNYNWIINKINSWTNCYLLALPSITTSDLSITELKNIISSWALVYKWFSNLPSSYTGTNLKINGWLNFKPNLDDFLVYSDINNCADLKSDRLLRGNVLSKIQNTYSGTILKSDNTFSNILNIKTNILNPSIECDKFTCDLLKLNCAKYTLNPNCIWVNPDWVSTISTAITTIWWTWNYNTTPWDCTYSCNFWYTMYENNCIVSVNWNFIQSWWLNHTCDSCD